MRSDETALGASITGLAWTVAVREADATAGGAGVAVIRLVIAGRVPFISVAVALVTGIRALVTATRALVFPVRRPLQ